MAIAARSTEEVLARFRRLQSGSDGQAVRVDEHTRNAYLQAAAMLHIFSLATLRPVSIEARPGVASQALFDLTVPAVGWAAENLRTLRLDVRRTALSRIRSRTTLKAALAANPDRLRTEPQSVLERWLNEGTLDPRDLSVDETRALRLLAGWGLDRFKGFPKQDDVERAWIRKSVVAPFEKLGEGFVGRRAELSALGELAGITPSSLRGWVRGFFSGGTRRPIYLHGPGGVGKTALIARFLLDYFENPKAIHFPFVYLPFDDPSLDPSEPVSLVAASLPQIEMQFHGETGHWAERVPQALEHCRTSLNRYMADRDALQERSTAFSSQRDRLGRLREIDAEVVGSFAELLYAACEQRRGVSGTGETVPAVMILDTFEEVDYKPIEQLLGIQTFLGKLLRELPNLRLIVAGRSPPEAVWKGNLSVQPLPLGDMETEDAVALLMRFRVRSRKAADAVVRQLGRNPLTLRLAARVLSDTRSEDALHDIKTRSFGLFRAGEQVIRGQLYKRILAHIHDPDIRRLAHPGMVLRRITPNLIHEVLSPVCGLPVAGIKEAERLFDELSREHSLVFVDASGALTYREEIRRPMLSLLTADMPQQAEDLHRRAFRYYANRKDSASAAEAIYHCLMLDQPDTHFIERRWTPELERYLAPAIEELPPSGRVALSSVMSFRLSEQDRAHGRTADAERATGRTVLQRFRYADFTAALDSIEELGRLSPGSPLHALRARALLALDRPDEARRALNAAIEDFPATGNQGRLAELLWLAAQAARAEKRDPQAAYWLEQLIPIAQGVHVLALAQALMELIDVAEGERAASARAELAAVLLTLEPSDVERERSLIRLALCRIGPSYLKCWQRLAPMVSYELGYRLSLVPRIADNLNMLSLAVLLSESTSPALATAGRMLEGAGDGLWDDVIDIVVKDVSGPQPHPTAVTALWEFYKVEGATLIAASLAGLHGMRENWELESDPEALA